VSPGCDTVSSIGTDATNHTTHKPTTVSTNLKLQLVEPAMILFVRGGIKFSGTEIEISIHYITGLVGGAITILKNISQWEGLSHILWTNEKCFKPPTR
jgi:hypothetical protein